jgi:hypothetical protein
MPESGLEARNGMTYKGGDMADKGNRDVRDADEVVREYYEGGESTDAASDDVREEFRDAQKISGGETTRALQAEGSVDIAPRRDARSGEPDVGQVETGDDIDAGRDGGGEEAGGGSHALPDQDDVEEIGKAVGLTYEDSEPLRADDKVAERDAKRWELNPASSEDYQERVQAQREEPAGGDGRTARGTRDETDRTAKPPRSETTRSRDSRNHTGRSGR